jgi:hypothetical protein
VRNAFLFVLSVLLAACSSGPCDSGFCECRGGDRCDYACGVPGCTGVCQSLSECDGRCVDGCDLSCADVSTCTLTCGDACTVTCERLSTCDLECGAGCSFVCEDASTCRVRMVSGVARCARVSTCDVACITPAGDVDATDCGGGVFGCGECATP